MAVEERFYFHRLSEVVFNRAVEILTNGSIRFNISRQPCNFKKQEDSLKTESSTKKEDTNTADGQFESLSSSPSNW